MEQQECECGHLKWCHTEGECLKYSYIHECDCKEFKPRK